MTEDDRRELAEVLNRMPPQAVQLLLAELRKRYPAQPPANNPPAVKPWPLGKPAILPER